MQIAHGVRVGQRVLLAAQVGIAGSTRIGSRVVLAGQVGVADHLTIGDDVVVAARSAVATSLPSRMVAMGAPALPRSTATEIYMYTRRLKGLFEDLGRLKSRLAAIESDRKKG